MSENGAPPGETCGALTRHIFIVIFETGETLAVAGELSSEYI